MKKGNVEFFMGKALDVARNGLNMGELPIGAVIILGNDVIASAFTSEQVEKRFLVHAELLALEKMDKLKLSYKDRQRARLFVNLEPCMMCLGAAMSSFVGELYYGLPSKGDGAVEMAKKWVRKESDIPGYRLPDITGGILADETMSLFEKYVSMHNSGAMWEWAKTIISDPS
ncbi:nucleoside deaminase [Elusimicrobiota bacterium]